jgi:hypothetical protein
MKAQLVVDKRDGRVICTAFAEGRRHDLRLFKPSRVRLLPRIESLTDTGSVGIGTLHAKATPPKRRSQNNPLAREDKAVNRAISSRRVLNENVIGDLKRFHIIADTYRNRRKRFGLRFNLIAGICNDELAA